MLKLFWSFLGLLLLLGYTSQAQISGPTSVCPGSTQAYSISMSGTKTWSADGGTVVSGQGTSQVYIQWGSNPSKVNLTLKVFNAEEKIYEYEYLSRSVSNATGSGGVLSIVGYPSVTEVAFCSPAAGDLSLAGNTGSVIRWEWTTDGSNWNYINNTNPWHQFSDLTIRTSFRALIAGTCGNLYSSVVTIGIKGTPLSAPTVTNGYACVGERAILSASGGVSYQWYVNSPNGLLPIPGSTANTFTTEPLDANNLTYYVKAFSAEGCASPAAAATAYANPIPSAPATPSDFIYNCESTTVNIMPAWPGFTHYWQTAVNGTSTSNSALTYTATTPQTVYLRNRNNSTGCWSSATEVQIAVFTPPAAPQYTVQEECGKTLLIPTIVNPFHSYYWQTTPDGTSTNNSGTLSVTVSGTYYLRAYKNKCWSPATAVTVTVQPFLNCLEGQNVNFVLTNTIQKEGVKNESEITYLSEEENAPTVTYFDGLARPIQQVGVFASPSKQDVVQMMAYDSAGRENKKYLPFTTNAQGKYIADPLSEMLAFYSEAGAATDNRVATTTPWAETLFEESPLGRVKEQGAPGEAWQLGTGKTIKSITRPNDEWVRVWNFDFTAGTCSSPGFYALGELLVNETTDEQGASSWSYTDKQGRVVLTKKHVVGSQVAQTYYVFDSFSQLRMVIQPEGVKSIPVTGEFTPDETFIAKWCFTYRYDKQGRMTEKRVPGAEPVYYVYNQRDQLIMNQDGQLRKNNQWNFTKYDAPGRVIMTGLYTHPAAFNQVEMQAAADAVSGQVEQRTAQNFTTQFGYTLDKSFPTLPAAGSQILTVNYFDDYDFDFNPTTVEPVYTPSGMSLEPIVSEQTTGMATGSLVRVLGTDKMLQSIFFYDKWGHLIQAQKDNHLEGKDILTSRYDFAGKVLESKQKHSVGTSAPITIAKFYAYDHAGRLLKLDHRINDQPAVTLAAYRYNELGQSIEKNLHGANGENYLQKVDQRYNIRGWLSKINDADLSDPTDLFGMELRYNEGSISQPGTAYFNGNIAELLYNDAHDKQPRAYVFTYDRGNRLTDARYAAKSATGWDANLGAFNEEGISYDLNGNVYSVGRYALFKGETTRRQIDYLNYTYQGNQLIRVQDLAPDVGGFTKKP